MDPSKYATPSPIEPEAAEATPFEPSAPGASQLLREVGASDALAAAYSEACTGLASCAEKANQADVRTFELTPGGDIGALQLISGVGLGSFSEETELGGVPGEPCLYLFTGEPLPEQTAIHFAVAGLGATALQSGEVPVKVVHTGPIDLLAHRFSMRPAPGGISVGHPTITAGTLGGLCEGRQNPRNSRLMILSNNHVIAANNQAKIGDDIVQPGVLDGGQVPKDVIGTLESFVPISFQQVNYVDCATAWVDPANVRPELIHIQNGRPSYFPISQVTTQAQPNMLVGKSGRTTQLTSGFVTAVGVRINVQMGNGRVATFDDQIAIHGVRGMFSAGGDSGSLVWTWDRQRNPVGLLFAGGGGTTFANPIDHVLNALDISLVV